MKKGTFASPKGQRIAVGVTVILEQWLEAPAYIGLTLHCHFGGRPLVCAVFDKILKHMAQFPDVWFASHGEIARWVLDEKIEAETHASRLMTEAVG